jgi:hypothetical protein
LCPGAGRARAGAVLNDGMDLVPELPINDCLMLTGVSCPFVDGIADVNPVVQQLVKDTFIEEMTDAVDRRREHIHVDVRRGEHHGPDPVRNGVTISRVELTQAFER